MKKVYDKFLSSGFQDLNQDSSAHTVSLYEHNYRNYLPQDKQAKILDIGCDMGSFLQFVGSEGFENYQGVDLSSEAIEYCQQKGIMKVKQIDDLLNYLTMSAETFDLIAMNDVIEHLPRAKVVEILEKIYEKLNRGGVFVVKTGNLASLVGPRIRHGDFTHYLGLIEYSLKQVLLVSGFVDVMVEPFVFPKNKITRIVRFVGQKIIHGLWKLVFFFEFTNVPKIVDELIFAVGRKK